MLRVRGPESKGLIVMAFLLAACGDSGSPTGSTGSGGQASTTTGAAMMSTSATMTTGTGSSSTGMPPPSPCTQNLLENCKQLKMCAPNLYKAQYENDDMLCQSEAVRLCATLPSALDNTNQGVVDPAACTTALSGTCDVFIASLDRNHLPAACRPKPGNLAANKGCVVDAQCAAGLKCYSGGPDTCKQYCAPVGKMGKPCQDVSGAPHDGLCDPENGLHCVAPNATPTYSKVCLPVTYGKSGDACLPGTDKQCDTGLHCSMKKCVAALQEGATCTVDPTDGDPCDARLLLSCALIDPSKPMGGSTCQAPIYVPDNATCGMVMDAGILHEHLCGAYSYCEPNTKVCKRKAMLNEGCVMDGCFPPYVCTAGSCQPPTLVTDPPCTADPAPPVTTLTCAISDGGMPFACAANQTCCLPTPMGTQIGYDLSTCAATCPTGTPSALQCNDSAQCTGGAKCNTVYPKNGTLASACNNTATEELCRMDDANACGGAGCKASMYWAIPANVGFCQTPTCKMPGSICIPGMPCNCCSGSSHFDPGSLVSYCN